MLLQNRFRYRYLIIIFLAFLPVFSFSQKRKKDKRKKNKCETVSEQDLIKYSSLSGVESSITKATGWSVQNNGAWYSMKNEIPFSDQRANPNHYGDRSLGKDNFIAFELRKLMIGNKQYNVLIKKYKTGSYEFPILKENWKPYKALDYYVFNSAILKKILPQKVTFNKAYAVNLNVFARGTIKNYNKKDWKSILVGNVQMVHLGEKINGWNLILAVYPIKNKGEEVVRFRLIKTFDNNYLVSMYTAPNDWKKLFSRSFYEVSYFTFKNFIDGALKDYIPVTPDIGKEGNSFQNNFNWGILKYQTGDYISAIKFFNKALTINPNTKDFLIFSYLGNAQSKLQRYNDAIASFDRALQLRPDNVLDYSNWVRNYFNRGVTKFYLNDTPGACKDWNKALELGFGTAYQYIQDYCRDINKDKKKK